MFNCSTDELRTAPMEKAFSNPNSYAPGLKKRKNKKQIKKN
jgi:hypothetical protein